MDTKRLELMVILFWMIVTTKLTIIWVLAGQLNTKLDRLLIIRHDPDSKTLHLVDSKETYEVKGDE